MLRGLLRRLGELGFVLFGVSVLTFLMIRLIPGDAVEIMLGANSEVTPEKVAELQRELGLDRPFVTQYLSWIGDILRGDFGESLWTGTPVIDEIGQRIWVTAELTILGLILAVVLSVPAGCLMAHFRSRSADYVLRVLTIAGVTMPSFWLGAMLLYAVASVAPAWAVVGWIPFTDDPLGNFSRLVLPVIALALPVLASLARIVRAGTIEALGQDYVRTARAKGVSETGVLFHHALRNALVPFVTSTGILAGYLFGGSVIVEQVFALPGLGRLMVGAIAERNYPLIQGSILLATAIFVVVSFIVDLIYAALDPRARDA